MIIKHTNKYDQLSYFTILDKKTIIWTGDFLLNRVERINNNQYSSIRPIGGPTIKIGSQIQYILEDIGNLTIHKIFDYKDGGYLIKLDKLN
jgi:hypothetical protein